MPLVAASRGIPHSRGWQRLWVLSLQECDQLFAHLAAQIPGLRRVARAHHGAQPDPHSLASLTCSFTTRPSHSGLALAISVPSRPDTLGEPGQGSGEKAEGAALALVRQQFGRQGGWRHRWRRAGAPSRYRGFGSSRHGGRLCDGRPRRCGRASWVSIWISSPGRWRWYRITGGRGSRAASRPSPRRRSTTPTVDSGRPSWRPIAGPCQPGQVWRRKASISSSACPGSGWAAMRPRRAIGKSGLALGSEAVAPLANSADRHALRRGNRCGRPAAAKRCTISIRL